MSRIAKKPRPVKGQKGTKKGLRPAKAIASKQLTNVAKRKRQPQPTANARFTIKKDSLGRQYALDKRTGKRAPLHKAEKERKKPIITFRGITAKDRSKAAKRGWETRRKKVIADAVIGKPPSPIELHERLWGPKRPLSFAEQEGALIPEGMRMRELGGVADRSELYPKVKAATDIAWINVQVDALRQRQALEQGIKESTMYTPRFDRLYGEGHGVHVRYDFYAHARDLEDLDQIIDMLDSDEDNDYVARELYTLYFSPEVA